MGKRKGFLKIAVLPSQLAEETLEEQFIDTPPVDYRQACNVMEQLRHEANTEGCARYYILTKNGAFRVGRQESIPKDTCTALGEDSNLAIPVTFEVRGKYAVNLEF